MTPAQWVLPKNHADIYKTIVSALPQGLSVTSEAPLTTVMELLIRPQTKETMLHFINFEKQKDVDAFGVRLRRKGSVQSVNLFSPELDQPAKLQFELADQAVSFTVPSIRTYAMVVVT